jgi:hypothetical protein
MWGNTVAIHSVLKKKKYKAKLLTSSILKNKIDKDNFVEKKQKKNKNNWEKKQKKCEKKRKKMGEKSIITIHGNM